MFTAKRENNELFSVANFKDRQFLLRLREREKFYCPCCNERVILKLGKQRSFHFSHLQGKSCTHLIEPESVYHMSGKLQLFNWLQAQQLEPQLEPYLKEINQRPDVLFSYEDVQYVIEFQCSSISPELYSKRTRTYLKGNYVPLWLLGGNFVKRKGVNRFTISNFQSMFLKENLLNNWVINYFCPKANRFVFINNLAPISPTLICGNMDVIRKADLTIDQLINPKTNLTVNQTKALHSNHWQSVQYYKQNYSVKRNFYNDTFLKEMYENNIIISQLHPFIGIPTPAAILIKSSPLVWQAYLYLDNFHYKEQGENIYLADIYKNFNNRINNSTITVRKWLFFKRSYYQDAIINYLLVLIKLNVLEKIDYDLFRLKTKLNINYPCTGKELDYFKKRINEIVNNLN